MPEPDLPSFDMEEFVLKYQAASALHAAELGKALSTLQIRMDAGFADVNGHLDRIERVLALAHPDEYRQAFSENGHNPPEQGRR